MAVLPIPEIKLDSCWCLGMFSPGSAMESAAQSLECSAMAPSAKSCGASITEEEFTVQSPECSAMAPTAKSRGASITEEEFTVQSPECSAMVPIAESCGASFSDAESEVQSPVCSAIVPIAKPRTTGKKFCQGTHKLAHSSRISRSAVSINTSPPQARPYNGIPTAGLIYMA